MVLEPTTKCMLGIECEWNGGLVDWKGNGDDEKVWFHNTKIHSFVQSYNYIDKLPTWTLNGLHIWSLWALVQ